MMGMRLTVMLVAQIVWKASQQIGCAYQYCPGGITIAVCEYDPYGNVSGGFQANVSPRVTAG
jgi:hypothetical protein